MEHKKENIKSVVEDIKLEISKGIIGQEEVVNKVLIGMIAGGNVLLEGVPGLGKTELVKAFSRVFDLGFSRIQFTPDLMPQDVIGTNILIREKDNSYFKFQKGPIFSNLVLADEINRATPKTQSAMLQAMQEKSVTSGNDTFELQEPFFVLATQNPVEMEGTYPLPEAQTDRFMFKVEVGFPSVGDLKKIVSLTTKSEKPQLSKIVDGSEVLSLRELAMEVPISDSVMEYAMKLVSATHPGSPESTEMVDKYVRFGSSPRGAQSIIKASKVFAMMEGRLNVSYKDIKYVAYDVLRHRVHLNFEGVSEEIKIESIIDDIFDQLDDQLKKKVEK